MNAMRWLSAVFLVMVFLRVLFYLGLKTYTGSSFVGEDLILVPVALGALGLAWFNIDRARKSRDPS